MLKNLNCILAQYGNPFSAHLLHMNSRALTVRQSVKYFYNFIFWTPVFFLSLLLVYNTIPYFSFNPDFIFLEERAVLYEDAVWRACFYVHIFAGMFCITTALLQFSSYLLRKRRAIHVWAGKTYVLVVLILGAPTGLYMSFFAKGGFWERALFVFMAVSWFFFTLKGYEMIRKKNVLAHQFWMMRSYAMALTAVTFRIYHILFFYGGVEHLLNYEISLWISVLGNMLFAEAIIYFKSKAYLKTFSIH